MGESARTQPVQRPLPRMAKGCVAQIVPQRDGLCQIFIEAQRPSNGTGDLTDLQRMGEPGAVMIPLRRKEYLRFLLETAERLAVQNTVPVPLEAGAHHVRFLGAQPPSAVLAQHGKGTERQPLNGFGLFPDGHTHAPLLYLLRFSVYKYDKKEENAFVF